MLVRETVSANAGLEGIYGWPCNCWGRQGIPEWNSWLEEGALVCVHRTVWDQEPDLMTSYWCSRGCKIQLGWVVSEMVHYSVDHDGHTVLPMWLEVFPSKILYEPRHEKTCLGHMRTIKVQISLSSVISAYVVRCLDSLISLVSIFAISWL